ncbi:hypothetical protein NDI49_03310 [Trichocoleus sp. ST-U3]
MITPANATQLPAVVCQKFQAGVREADGLGGGVCVDEAAGFVVAVGFGGGEDFAVGEATGVATGGFGFWAILVLASKKLNKTALEAKTRF